MHARRKRILVIGAGIGGLSAALELARRGAEVVLLERADRPGGKMREVFIDGRPIDSGPTVLTLPEVFADIFGIGFDALVESLGLRPCEEIARHAWQQGGRLDLYCDRERSADAVAEFSSRAEADRYLAFCRRAESVYATLDRSFMRNPRPGMFDLVRRTGLASLGRLWAIQPFRSLWHELGRHFRDPRLRALFARYSTYCGASPLQAPATLMLIAHVENLGVWRIPGGLQRLAEALADAIRARGGDIRYGAKATELEIRNGRAVGVRLEEGERIAADAVIANIEPSAIATGALGPTAAAAVPASATRARSLSAMTWSMIAEASGFELGHHNVFFPADYPREFEQIFGAGRLPETPAVYICAPGDDGTDPNRARRMFLITNAPADGDRTRYSPSTLEHQQAGVLALLRDCGLHLDVRPERAVITTPEDFERRFPGSGGALYGSPPHGWRSSFTRPQARSRLPGLYLAGGSVHPGPGVPMVALSGRFAASTVATDLGVDA